MHRRLGTLPVCPPATPTVGSSTAQRARYVPPTMAYKCRSYRECQLTLRAEQNSSVQAFKIRCSEVVTPPNLLLQLNTPPALHHYTTSTSTRCGQRGMALARHLPVSLFSFLCICPSTVKWPALYFQCTTCGKLL
jgi:hypothetical protein